MTKKLLGFLFVLEKNPIFSSIKKGLLISYLIFLFGAVTHLLYILPGMEDGGFLATWQSGLIIDTMTLLYNATIGNVSLYLVIAISYYYAQSKNLSNPLLLLMAVLTSTIQFTIGMMAIKGDEFSALFGSTGLLLAIITAIVTTYHFLAISNWILQRKYITDLGSEDSLKITWMSIFPMFSTLAYGSLIYSILINTITVPSLYNLGITAISNIFTTGNELLSGLVYTFFVNLCWFFGAHGSTVLEPITTEFLFPATYDTTRIVSRGFLESFAQIGGSGCVICLTLAIILVKSSKKYRKPLKGSMLFSIFNISELIVFTYSIILNPIMFIPFIGVPLVSATIAYFATVIGFLPIVDNYLSWSIPAGFSGYLSTHSINGVVVQIFIIAIGTLIYIPFVELNNRFQEEKDAHILESLIKEFQAQERTGNVKPLLTRTDYAGQIAKSVVQQLKHDIDTRNIDIYYQPQLNANDVVIGAEALLRWNYNGKMLYPPFVIALAREEGINNALTIATLNIVTSAIKDINQKTGEDLHISMNFVADQIDNTLFVQQIIDIINIRKIKQNLYLELTEETSLSGLDNIEQNISLLAENGITMAIDDFGMGQTSLNYLQENDFNYVKLDGELVKNLIAQPRSAEIISSIISLGESLNYEVIAEYVETLEHKKLLMSLGCFIYQGYYYSPAISKSAFIEYCITTNKSYSKISIAGYL